MNPTGEQVLWHLMDPSGQTHAVRHKLSPRLDTVAGKTAGFRIQWSNFDVFMARFKELLLEREHPAGIHEWNLEKTWRTDVALRSRRDQVTLPKQFDAFASSCDWAVIGLAG